MYSFSTVFLADVSNYLIFSPGMLKTKALNLLSEKAVK